MTTYITSDLHFGHKNIMKYSPEFRSQWSSVEEMDAGLIDHWNSVVSPTDSVIHGGDFAFYHDVGKIQQIIAKLNGNITFIMGNHDRALMDAFKVMPTELRSKHRIRDYLEMNHGGTKVCIFHFPMVVWNKSHHGSVHLHGHCHGSLNYMNGDLRRMDVGFDSLGRVMNLDEAVKMTLANPIKSVDHHGVGEMR